MHLRRAEPCAERGAHLFAARTRGLVCALTPARQLSARVPGFRPGSLLDFGSGPGTAVLAASATWPAALRESVCVELSRDMLELADVLRESVNAAHRAAEPEPAEGDAAPRASDAVLPSRAVPHLSRLNGRQQRRRYDLVIAAFSLGELSSEVRLCRVSCVISLSINRSCYNSRDTVRRWLASRPCSACGHTPQTSSSSWSLARPRDLRLSAPRAAPCCSSKLAKCEMPQSVLPRLGTQRALPNPLQTPAAQAVPRSPPMSSLKLLGHTWWRLALTTSAAPWTARTGGVTFRSACSGLTRSAPSKAGHRRAHTRRVLRTRALHCR